VIVSVYVFFGVLAPRTIVSVEFVPVATTGLKLALLCGGSPLTDSVTPSAKPLRVTVIVDVFIEP